MAKSKRKNASRASPDDGTLDKLAKAAMSREMLAAGLAAAAAAISASPSARRKIRDAGIDAADSAQAAASTMVTSASKLGSLIAEAVADAAQRVMLGKWEDDSSEPEEPVTRKRTRSKGGIKRSAKKGRAVTSTVKRVKGSASRRARSAHKITTDRPIPPSKPGK